MRHQVDASTWGERPHSRTPFELHAFSRSILVDAILGDLTLSTIALLHDSLTEATYGELVEAAAGGTASARRHERGR
jgi:hypothetical protein